jgi:hypothetical protein
MGFNLKGGGFVALLKISLLNPTYGGSFHLISIKIHFFSLSELINANKSHMYDMLIYQYYFFMHKLFIIHMNNNSIIYCQEIQIKEITILNQSNI